jgi:hypothetical protein
VTQPSQASPGWANEPGPAAHNEAGPSSACASPFARCLFPRAAGTPLCFPGVSCSSGCVLRACVGCFPAWLRACVPACLRAYVLVLPAGPPTLLTTSPQATNMSHDQAGVSALRNRSKEKSSLRTGPVERALVGLSPIRSPSLPSLPFPPPSVAN